MISVHDFLAGGGIPYGLECEPPVLWHLPLHTYLQLQLPTYTRLGMLVGCGRYSTEGSEYAVIEGGTQIAYAFKALKSVAPVSDEQVLKMVPVGSKVELYVQDPKLGTMVKVAGFVAHQYTRRVRVQFSYADGSPGERTVHVSKLIF